MMTTRDIDEHTALTDTALTRFFHMRQLRAIKQSLTPDAIMTLVRALVGNRLDNCNSLLAGVSSHLLQKLQLILNAAARLVTGVRRSEHMTRILRPSLSTDSTVGHA